MKRIIAKFYPEVWINNWAIDTGPPIEFDATDQILAMSRDEALEIYDDQYESDDLVPSAILDDHKSRYGTEACFRVVVRQAILDYFGIEESS